MDDWSEILESLGRGELTSFDRVTRLVTSYLSRIGAYDYRDSWDDLVQEVLISLLRTPPASNESGAIVRHIQTTTQRKFIDQVRRERGRRRTDSVQPDEGSGWRVNVPFDESVERNLERDANNSFDLLDTGLRKALDRLDDRQRLAIDSRYALGCSNEEGAKRLRVSVATYKRVLSAAIGELRSQLVPAEVPP